MCLIDWEIMSCGLSEEIDKGIILYGASGTGKKMVTLLNNLGLTDKVLAVVDSNNQKWGNKWMQYEIQSPKALNFLSSEAIIVITSVYLSEIYYFLQSEIKCSQRICSSFSLKHAIHYDIMNNMSNYIKDEIIENYKIQYELWKKNRILIAFTDRYQVFFNMIKYIIENQVSILLCGIQKTGNVSLKTSFELNKNLNNVIFTYHTSYCDMFTYEKIKEVLQLMNQHEIKIISGVREPIERIVSQKWQRMDFPYSCSSDSNIPLIIDEHYENFITRLISYETLKTKLSRTKFDYTNGGISYYADIADWFEDHIKKTFDINVFEYPFNKEKGYSIIKNKNISIFIYRLDKLSKLEKEIGEFVGNVTFTLTKSNVASEKKYVFAYKEYLKKVKIKKSFFDSLTCSKGMTHFYTQEECEKYKNKWKDRLI